MICKPCKAGGLLLIEARQAPLVGNRMFLLAETYGRHDECENPRTCTCQHRVAMNRGDLINDGN